MNDISKKYKKSNKYFLYVIIFILSFSYLFSNNKSDADGGINIWDLFPHYTEKEPIKVRNFSMHQNLIKTEIKEENGQKKIIWQYKVQLGGLQEFLDENDKIEHFFSTTKTSGLGMPVITKVIGPNNEDKQTEATDKNTNEFNTTKAVFDLGDFSYEDGWYEFTVETPITEVRDNYTLYVNSMLTAKMYAGENVAPAGVEAHNFAGDTIIKVPSIVSSTVKSDDNYGDSNNLSLTDLKSNVPNFKETNSDGVISQGSYINENQVRWTATYMNENPGKKEDANFDFTLDNSQIARGKVKVYHYKATDNGYEQTKVKEVDAGAFTINDVEPGTILQAVLETDIKDRNNSHNIGSGAEIESMYANLTIKKIWVGIPADDSRFKILYKNNTENKLISKEATTKSTDGNQTTIFEGQDRLKFEKSNDNPQRYTRISYSVEEKEDEKYELSWSTVDRERLIFTFANKERYTYNPNTPPEIEDDDTGQCGTQVYGVYEVNPIKIHSYRYGDPGKDEWFGYGGGIEGKFKIPANTGKGSYFTLKIPPELKIEKAVSDDKKWSDIYDSKGIPIGEMYLTKRDEVTFRLNDSAKRDQDYDGFFYIGYPQIGTKLFMVDGKRVTEEEAKKYHWGIVQDPAIFYDKSDPQNKNVTTKVEYFSTFYNKNTDNACRARVGSTANINYNDPEILENMQEANKYVVEDNENENYLMYELVFNAGRKIGITTFNDYLSETIELYHGNSKEAIEKDIEVYVGEPTASCTVDKNTIKQIYPKKEVSSPSITISTETLNKHIDNESRTKSGKNVIENFKITFRSNEFNGKTFLVKMKAKKINATQIPDGRYLNYVYNSQLYAYNRIEVLHSNGRKTNFQNAYATTLAGGGGDIAGGEKGKFRIRKVFSIKDSHTPIKNNPATFELSETASFDTPQTVKTDKNGYADFTNLEKGRTYYLREKHSPKGYKKNGKNYRISVSETNVNDVKIKELPDGKEESVSFEKPIDIVNERLLPLKIKKVDKNSNKSLTGAVFRLRNKDSNTPKYDVTLGKDQSISEFAFNGLTYGSYILEEITAPKGYKKIPPIELIYDEQLGEIIKGSDFFNIESTEPTIEGSSYIIKVLNDTGHKPVKNKVRFVKTNQYGKRLRDDLYKIFEEKINNGEINLNGQVKKDRITDLISEFSNRTDFYVYKKLEYTWEDFDSIKLPDGNKIVPYLKDNADVLASMDPINSEFEFDGLPAGKYWIVEKARPANTEAYEIFKKVYEMGDFTDFGGGSFGKALISFEVNDKGFVTKVNDKESKEEIINVKNFKKSVSFNLRKVDYQNQDTPLEGAEFTLYRKKDNNKEQVDKQSSDVNGFVHFEDIVSGSYSLVETKAPSDYSLDKTTYDVEVSESLKVVIKKSGQVINPTGGLYKITNQKSNKLSIIKKDQTENLLKGTAKFCLFKVGDDVSATDIEEALRNNDGWSLEKNKTNCTWHEYTDDKGDDLIRLRGKDYYLPKKPNNGINYQLFEVKNGKLDDQNLKFKTPGKYLFAEYESPEGYDVIKKPLLLELKKEKNGSLKFYAIGNNDNISFDNSTDIMRFSAKNNKISAKFAVKKAKETDNKTINPIGEDLNSDLEVEFKLTKLKNMVAPDVEISDGDIDKSFGANGFVTKTWKLKENTVFENLSIGYYALEETKAPSGYAKTGETYRIQVDKKGSVTFYVYNKKTEVRHYDIKSYEMDVASWFYDKNNLVRIGNKEVKKSKISFYKKILSKNNLQMQDIVDKDLKVEFKLTKDNDATFKEVKQEKKVSEKFTFEDLYAGVYTLEETKVPEGHIKGDYAYKLSIDELGDVRVYKYDSNSKSNPLWKGTFSHNLNTNNTIANDALTQEKEINKANEVVFNLKNSVIEKEQWIQRDLGSIHYISEISLAQNSVGNSNNNDAFDNIDLEYSFDGKTFYKLKNYENSNSNKRDSNNSLRTIKFDTPICARFIRFTNKVRSENRWLRISEFKISGFSIEDVKEIKLKDQENQSFDIGNIENPQMKIIKVDEFDKPINQADAEFELRKVPEQTSAQTNIDENAGILVHKIVVKNGQSQLQDVSGNNIPDNKLRINEFGKYILVEKTSPIGFKKLQKPILIEAEKNWVNSRRVSWFKKVAGSPNDNYLTISQEGQTNTIKFNVKNKKIRSKFAFNKKIETKNKPMIEIGNKDLEAEFKLTKDNDLLFRPITQKKKVSEQFLFDNLSAGEYTLVETKAPIGYIKTDEIYKVKIDDNGNLVVYKDKKDKTAAKIKSTLVHSFGNITIDDIANATDDNDNTEAKFHLQNSTLKKNDYVQLEFDAPYYVTSLKFLQNTVDKSAGNDAFDDVDLEYSINGVDFYKYNNYKNTKGKDNSIKTINEDNPFVAKYVRFRNNVDSGNRWLRISRFEATGYKVEAVNDLANDSQDNLLAKDIFDIGNLENPQIKIIKQNDNGVEIAKANAEFELRKVDDKITDSTNLDDKSGELIHTLIIENGVTKLKDKNGIDVKDNHLQFDRLGKYILVEKRAPKGYKKLEKPILLEAKANFVSGKRVSWLNEVTNVSHVDIKQDGSENKIIIKVNNKKIKSKFAFYKKSESSTNQMSNIEGALQASFKLTKDGDNSFTARTITQNVSEKFIFDNLDAGDYTLEEIQAPSGYVKTENIYKIRVDDEGLVKIFKDKKGSQDLKIENTTFGYNIAENGNPNIDTSNVKDGNIKNEVIFRLTNSKSHEGDYIELSLDKVHHISKINLWLNNSDRESKGNDAFDDVYLEYSLDGKTFVKYKKFKNTSTQPNGNNINIINENVDLYAKVVRFKNAVDSGNRWLSISEFELTGHEADFIKELTRQSQDQLDNNTFDIGNVQNPKIVIEKIDGKTGELIEDDNKNKNYNAKFALYKIPDNSVDVTNLDDSKKIKDFSLQNGRVEISDNSITELGRYVLVETESPEGYNTVNPIILDLVKAKKNGENKLTLAWKIVGQDLSNDNLYDITKNIDDQKIVIDYSKLFDKVPIIGFKVKNYRDDVGKVIFDKVIKKTNTGLNGASFKLTKDNDEKFTPIVKEGDQSTRFVFENLQPGDYTLDEIRIPKGYMKDSLIYKVNVNNYGDSSLFAIKGNEKSEKISLTSTNLIKSPRYNNLAENEANIFDDDINSQSTIKLWNPNDYVDKDEFVGIDLKGLYKIDSFKFNQGPQLGSNTGNDAYDNFVIEYSLDGINYRKFKKYDNPNGSKKPSDNQRNQIYDIEENMNIYARYIRIRNLSKATNRWLRIRNISATGYKVNEVEKFIKNKNDNAIGKVENIEKPKIKLKKVDDDGNKITSSNAKFSLYRVLDNENNKIYSQENGVYKVNGITLANISSLKEIKKNFEVKNGEIIFDEENINVDQLGKYILVEEDAPKSYMKVNSPILLELKEGSKTGKSSVSIDVLNQKDIVKVEMEKDGVFSISITNKKFVYPETGGIGTLMFMIFGLIIMNLGIYYYYKKSFSKVWIK